MTELKLFQNYESVVKKWNEQKIFGILQQILCSESPYSVFTKCMDLPKRF